MRNCGVVYVNAALLNDLLHSLYEALLIRRRQNVFTNPKKNVLEGLMIDTF